MMERRSPSPEVLPFRAPVPDAIGSSVVEVVRGGRTIVVSFDRYRTADCRWLEVPCYVDALHPDESFTVRFEEVEGEAGGFSRSSSSRARERPRRASASR